MTIYADNSLSIGRTPLVELQRVTQGCGARVLAKIEGRNPAYSVKCRIGAAMIWQAEQDGLLGPGKELIEPTSGNTGIALAFVAASRGIPLTLTMPETMSLERRKLLTAYGAKLLLTEGRKGMPGAIGAARELADSDPDRYVLLQQFANPANPNIHHDTTGPEIWDDTEGRVDVLVAGVGTGGTIMGVGRALRALRPEVRLHPLEPANSPTLSTGHKVGKHRIQGISDEFIPAICRLADLDRVISVDDGDAILMARKLAAELGLGVGISSGANFLGALLVQDDLGPDAVVATVFPDDNKKYLSTDLLQDEPVRDGFLAPEVELLGFRAFKRVCQTCCDPLDCMAPGTAVDLPLPPCPRRESGAA